MLQRTHAQEVAILKKNQQLEEQHQVSQMTVLLFVTGFSCRFQCAGTRPCFFIFVVETQVQSHIHALEDLREKIEARLVLIHQEREAANAKNKGLQDVTKSLKEQRKLSVLDRHQEYSALTGGRRESTLRAEYSWCPSKTESLCCSFKDFVTAWSPSFLAFAASSS